MGSHQDAKSLGAPFVAVLKACAQNKDLYKGVRVHADILKRGLLEKNPYVASSLVSMYAKCGALKKAQQVLDELPVRDVVSWSALIAGYAQQGKGEEALSCFKRMQDEGFSPNSITFCSVLKACGSIGAADKGKQIHNVIVSHGLLRKNITLGNALVDMYAKCGALAKAQQVLDELPMRDVVSWSALITGYALQGQGEEALSSFERMRREGLYPNAVTFICILKACGSVRAAHKGKQIHDEIVSQGLLQEDIVLGNALLDMYAKCGALSKAQQVLDELPVRDIVSWNALIAGYAQEGHGKEALTCFERMQGEDLSPDVFTFIGILKACGSIRAADKGHQVYAEMVSHGLVGNDIVLGTALVDMYAKCGALVDAQQVHGELSVWDVVSWNALIAGFAQQGQGEEALNCFGQMQHEGFSPDAVTFICILKACGSVGAADKGKQIHNEIVNQALLEKDIVLGNALVDMYARCGSLAEAQQVLDEIPVRNVVTWSSLIAGYAQQGQGKGALNCFKQMKHEGFPPDGATFTCVLNACSRSGLVQEGQMFLVNMSRNYGVLPVIEHYTCIVDLFGRAGCIDKAVAVIKKMPAFDDPPVWSALLGACLKWGNVKLGRWAFEHAIQIDKSGAQPS